MAMKMEYDSISWECLGGDHRKCSRPVGNCSCSCHVHKQIMDDIRANSPDMQ